MSIDSSISSFLSFCEIQPTLMKFSTESEQHKTKKSKLHDVYQKDWADNSN